MPATSAVYLNQIERDCNECVHESQDLRLLEIIRIILMKNSS